MAKDTTHPLARWRKSQKPPLTQAEFAKKLGLKKRWTIAAIETGHRGPSLAMAQRIRAITGIPVAELLPDLAKALKADEAA